MSLSSGGYNQILMREERSNTCRGLPLSKWLMSKNVKEIMSSFTHDQVYRPSIMTVSRNLMLVAWYDFDFVQPCRGLQKSEP